MTPSGTTPLIAIACGGTGGHLFPGLATAEVLQRWGCDIALLVSKKEVDQEAVKSAVGMRVLPLPAIALQNRQWGGFAKGCWESYRICEAAFRERPPRAVLAMGGFTSAPPVLAGKRLGAATFLHESNSVPGRANRWLSPWVDEIFVGFREASQRLSHQSIRHVGTPVRAQFKLTDPSPCRMSLRLQPDRPVLLVMGGSQGASGINKLMQGALPLLAAHAPELQFLHLTGGDECERMRAVYAAHTTSAVVRPFLTEMDLALGAATLVVNRAGASSLAELAAMRVPAVLIPYPYATDDHQLFNARAFANTGAAKVLEQASTTPELLANSLLELLRDDAAREKMRSAIAQWDFPQAAENMAELIFAKIGLRKPEFVDEVETPLSPQAVPGRPRNWPREKFKLSAPGSKSQP